MSQTLAFSPSAWTALLIALTNASVLGQLGAWARGQPQFPRAPAGMKRGTTGKTVAQGSGLGLPLAPAPKQKSHHPSCHSPKDLPCLGGGRTWEALLPDGSLEMKQGWDGVLGQPPSGMSPGTCLFQGSSSRSWETALWLTGAIQALLQQYKLGRAGGPHSAYNSTNARAEAWRRELL